MSTIEIKNTSGKSVGKIDLDDSVFSEDVNEHLLWETVKWQRARKRSGNHSTKTRGEIRGSTKKIYKQKGTGGARHGSRKANIFVGGGIVFGPRPRDYGYSMPKKARKKALRGALSLRLADKKLVVLDEFPVADGKTAHVAKVLAQLGAEQPTNRVLIVEQSNNEGLIRGARNLSSSKWIAPEAINVYDVLDHDTLMMTKSSVETVVKALRPSAHS